MRQLRVGTRTCPSDHRDCAVYRIPQKSHTNHRAELADWSSSSPGCARWHLGHDVVLYRLVAAKTVWISMGHELSAALPTWRTPSHRPCHWSPSMRFLRHKLRARRFAVDGLGASTCCSITSSRPGARGAGGSFDDASVLHLGPPSGDARGGCLRRGKPPAKRKGRAIAAVLCRRTASEKYADCNLAFVC
jgi:hypothetical protein